MIQAWAGPGEGLGNALPIKAESVGGWLPFRNVSLDTRRCKMAEDRQHGEEELIKEMSLDHK